MLRTAPGVPLDNQEDGGGRTLPWLCSPALEGICLPGSAWAALWKKYSQPVGGWACCPASEVPTKPLRGRCRCRVGLTLSPGGVSSPMTDSPCNFRGTAIPSFQVPSLHCPLMFTKLLPRETDPDWQAPPQCP